MCPSDVTSEWRDCDEKTADGLCVLRICVPAGAELLAVNKPGTALAATGSADCGGGQKVQCCVDCSKVTRCDCQDGVGCTVTYDDDSTRKKLCSSFDGPPVEETAN